MKKERMLDKRKAIMKARIAKIKQRRLQREGRTVDDDVVDSECCSVISVSVLAIMSETHSISRAFSFCDSGNVLGHERKS